MPGVPPRRAVALRPGWLSALRVPGARSPLLASVGADRDVNGAGAVRGPGCQCGRGRQGSWRRIRLAVPGSVARILRRRRAPRPRDGRAVGPGACPGPGSRPRDVARCGRGRAAWHPSSQTARTGGATARSRPGNGRDRPGRSSVPPARSFPRRPCPARRRRADLGHDGCCRGDGPRCGGGLAGRCGRRRACRMVNRGGRRMRAAPARTIHRRIALGDVR